MIVSTFFAISLFACSDQEEEPKAEAVTSIQEVQKTIKGDLGTAKSTFQKALDKNPQDTNALVGMAYLASLRGDYTKADELLQKAEVTAKDKSSLFLQRAIVALQTQDLESARLLAEQSNTDYGTLIAAELDIVDDENDAATEKLQGLSSSDFSEISERYLALLNSDNEGEVLLAVAYAAWGLGDKSLALQTFESALENLGSYERIGDELLVWTGRAIQEKDLSSASSWTKNPKFSKVSSGNEWRVKATKAIVACGSSKGKKCYFKNSKAPIKGIEAAKVTAARLIMDSNPKQAEKLLKGIEGSSAAYVFYKMDDSDSAEEVATGKFQDFLND
ncbi:MAG: tetratricopeptide repeat protein [Myxococcota bacterium]|nr:tetratricopeptide repeat protein [Myxococcota bacterium]